MTAWSDDDDEYLRHHHGVKTHDEIGKVLGRTRNAVRNRAYRLGLSEKRWWTDAEREVVRLAYEGAGDGKLDLSQLAETLGRSRTEICVTASKMGLTNQARMKTENGPKDRRKYKGDEKALKEAMAKATRDWIAENGHPRGFLGGSHSQETRKTISERSKARWDSLTQEERDEHINKAIRTRVKNGNWGATKNVRKTWAAGWREIGGRKNYYRSRWEANYARYLQWLKSQGQIKEWAYEPEVFWFEQIKRGVRSYKPDFRVWENDGSSALHEVKGWMDSRSKTTLRRMAKYYPEEKIVLIDGSCYRAIRLKVMGLIEGWEDHSRDART